MEAHTLDDMVLTEGDEEVQYVVLELPQELAGFLQPGSTCTLKDIDTDQPKLQLQNGINLKGAFDDNLGSLLVFEQQHLPDEHTATNQPAEGQAQAIEEDHEGVENDTEASGDNRSAGANAPAAEPSQPVALKYKCHTEKLITFRA